LINALAELIKQGASARVILISVVIDPAWRVQSADRGAGRCSIPPRIRSPHLPKKLGRLRWRSFLGRNRRAGVAPEGPNRGGFALPRNFHLLLCV
jgi:hypothetical protein